ncbi:hypothetical protein C1646_819584 [Rhizophagus diaphanus]|nr:hypothetical protein C1646_819584 [Rhizophagus diaphanus] [Rhizophagus sp. MUCL 43196]
MGDSMDKVYRDVVNYEYSSQTNLLIKILENTDHRQPKLKKEVDSNSQNKSDKPVDSDTINETIACTDKTTTKHKKGSSGDDEKNDKSKWSLDISNIHKNKKNDSDDSEYFIFVAISRINIDEDMKQEKDKKDDKKKA